MRKFDIKNNWLDNDGKPLAGRVSFCKLHTTELENVYDNQGNLSDNPIFTNTIGQLNWQVFLKDKTDYTIRFYKYVGNADMSEDNDNWLFQYSCDDLWNTYGIEVDSTTFQLVNNISDLRNLDPNIVTTRDNSKVIILGGYNTIGDKPQVMYIWNATSIENDNGGSVIKVEDIATGRWELVNTFGSEGVDVRHFGVFGADSKQEASDTMSLRIGIANDYATEVGLPLYFPCIDGITWYKMNNLTISGAKFAKETKVFGNTNTSSTLTVYDETSYLDVNNNSDYNAVFTITGPVVKTSWGVNSSNCIFNPTYKLIVDSVINTSNKSFDDIVIDCQYEILTDATFDNCQIHSIEKLGDDTTFRNCVLTENMFSDSTDFESVTVYDSDIIDIDNWPTTSKWLTLVSQNNNNVLDFAGRIVDNTCLLNWTTNATYKNAVFSNYTVNQMNPIFYNCSGNVNFTAATPQSVSLTESSIVFNMTANTLSDTLYAKNSSVSFGKNITVPNISMAFSTINDENYIFYATQAAFNNCAVNVAISSSEVYAKDTTFTKNILSTVPTLVNCNIQAIVRQNKGPIINFLIQNCIFGPNAYHDIYSDVSDAVVVGKWIGNIGQGNNPIRIDETNLASNDSQHTYTYENNMGTFLPSSNSKTLDLEPVITLPMPVFPTTYQNKAYFIDPGLIINPAGLSWYSGILLDLDAQIIPVFYIGNPAFDAEVEVSWKSNNGTFYSGNLYDGYGHAYAKRSFDAVGGMKPSTDKMRVWVQQFIQQCENNTFSDVKAKITITIKR